MEKATENAFWRVSDEMVEVRGSCPAIRQRTGSMNPVVAKELTPHMWEGERVYAIAWNYSFHDAHFEIVICAPGQQWMNYDELLRAVVKAEIKLCKLFDMSRKYFEHY